MFKNNLRKLREEKKLTQSELAKILGLSDGSIGNYEQGSREPRNETLKKMSEFFGVSIDYLLGFDKIKEGNHQTDISFDDFTYAMYNEAKDLTEEQKAAILNMAKAFKNSNKQSQ